MKKTSPKTTVYDSQKQASAALGIPLEKLRRAKKAGCPAFRNGRVDSLQLTAWIRAPKRTVRRAAPQHATLLASGTPENLRALEQAASGLWQDYEAARQSGDPEQSLYLKSWLECSEQLRRHDKDVSASRRSGQETIPRADIESLLGRILAYWATSLRRELLDVLAPNLTRCETLQERFDLLESVAHRGLLDAVADASSWTTNQPKWLLDCAESNLKGYFDKTSCADALADRVLILGACSSMNAETFRETVDFIKARINTSTP